MFILFFFFNDTATTEIYTLSLHDALPICRRASTASARSSGLAEGEGSGGRPVSAGWGCVTCVTVAELGSPRRSPRQDRKSTRLNSSHANISYAVFSLEKKISHTLLADAHR